MTSAIATVPMSEPEPEPQPEAKAEPAAEEPVLEPVVGPEHQLSRLQTAHSRLERNHERLKARTKRRRITDTRAKQALRLHLRDQQRLVQRLETRLKQQSAHRETDTRVAVRQARSLAAIADATGRTKQRKISRVLKRLQKIKRLHVGNDDNGNSYISITRVLGSCTLPTVLEVVGAFTNQGLIRDFDGTLVCPLSAALPIIRALLEAGHRGARRYLSVVDDWAYACLSEPVAAATALNSAARRRQF